VKITAKYIYIAFNVGIGVVLVPIVLPFAAAWKLANEMIDEFL